MIGRHLARFRYKRMGYANSQPADPLAAYELWNNAHTAALEDYGLREGRGVLYDASIEVD